ncbi:MAG TPA: protein translocase subunit SecDF [Saprospiraceae bacterium]|nr:protein translocase subunit SecDF [Saprospiraceae bacterium]
MQGKGLVKVFLVLITVVCLLQFTYFIPTNRVESDAASYASSISGSEDPLNESYKTARARYLDSMSSEEVFSIPLLKSYTYNELKQQQLALGLDLKGGMSTTLQVDLEDFLKSLAGRNANNVEFLKALDNTREAMRTSQSNYITLFVGEYRTIAGDNKLAKIFARSEALGEISTSTSDGEIERLLRSKADQTVNLTFERLKQRIDRLGVAQPNVSLDPNRDLILVEMPGIDNPERAKQFLTASAKLEFWEVYRTTDPGISAAFQQADARASGVSPSIDSTNVEMDTIKVPAYDDLGTLLPDSTIQLVPKTQNTATGATGSLFSALTLNSGNLSQSVMGLVEKGKRTFVNDILKRDDIKALFPKNSKFMWSREPSVDASGVTTNQYELYLIKTQTGTDEAPLDGGVITSAGQNLNTTNGKIEVNVRMNAAGAKKWAEMTTKAAGDGNREIAIALDDEVVSAPTVNDPITQGSSSITGNYTVEEATDFASILEVGKLPAKTKIVQSTNVGPTLGKANISKSINSLLIGFLLVIITMLAYYAGGGIIAIVSLLLNVFLIFGSLSSFGTVLTLSGIAGIVLTIGMAVDANVIIFERIKEELESGKDLKQSIADGFYHSYSAIIDANVTTILTAFILAYFGLGPVKGFAVVLIIGVLCSLFTAIFISRLMIDWWVGKGNNLSFWTGFAKGAFKNINIDWIGRRKIAYGISGVVILAGLISIFTSGFDLGVDYKGGYSYSVQFTGSENVTADALRDGLTAPFGATPVVKQVDAANTFNIVTSYLVNETAEDTPEKVMAKLHEGIVSITKSDVSLADFSNTETGEDKVHVISSAQVGPTIADDLKKSSLYAGLFALLAIFLYILIRFSKWQYSAGAIIALFHDALIVLSVFSIAKSFLPFSLEIDQAFIAALLTVIGYSINDTVIVFDRIREFFTIHSNKSKDEVINAAINTTLSRTLMTSFTTIVVILILFLFGGGSIKGFAFALLVGIIVGTYSSVFIAAPVLHDLGSDLKVNRRIVDKPVKSDEGKSFARSAK